MLPILFVSPYHLFNIGTQLQTLRHDILESVFFFPRTSSHADIVLCTPPFLEIKLIRIVAYHTSSMVNRLGIHTNGIWLLIHQIRSLRKQLVGSTVGTCVSISQVSTIIPSSNSLVQTCYYHVHSPHGKDADYNIV